LRNLDGTKATQRQSQIRNCAIGTKKAQGNDPLIIWKKVGPLSLRLWKSEQGSEPEQG
jgi:hypothetical protein